MPYWTTAVNHLIRWSILAGLFFFELLERIQLATFTTSSDFRGPSGINSFNLHEDDESTWRNQW